MYRIGILHGDAIGKEITPAAVRVTRAAVEQHAPGLIEWVELPMGFDALDEFGHPLPEFVQEELRACDAWVMGPHHSSGYPAKWRDQLSPSGIVRQQYELFANVRPMRSLSAVPSFAKNVDLMILRENSEGFYADRNMYFGGGEIMPTPDVALAIGVFTRPAIERIARAACEYAMARRRHLTVVHKDNVLRKTTGMFRSICTEVAAEEYPELTVDAVLMDAMTAHLVRRSHDFDVIVTENMFGDILSDLVGELAGGLGVAGSLNVGSRYAMAQAAHGSAPDIAGRDIANPIGMISSCILLLDWLVAKHDEPSLSLAARSMDAALEATLTAGVATSDLGGDATTTSFADAMIERLEGVQVAS